MTESSLAEVGSEAGRKGKSRSWARYEDFCEADDLVDPYLQSLSPKDQVGVMCNFAQAVRMGSWNNGKQVGWQNVSTHLLGVADKFADGWYRDPRSGGVGGEGLRAGSTLARPLAQLKEKFQKEDPAVQHKRAVPVEVVVKGHEVRRDNVEKRIADLVELGFTHLLRPCEHVKDNAISAEDRAEGSALLRARNFKFIRVDHLQTIVFDGKELRSGRSMEECEEAANSLAD